MASNRVRWCHISLGWLCLATSGAADVRDVVKKLQPATVAIDWPTEHLETAFLDKLVIATKIHIERVATDTVVSSEALRPRLIPLKYASATSVARTLQVLSNNGGGKDETRAAGTNGFPNFSFAADARTNSIVITAPDALYEQIKSLVEQLDQQPGSRKESVATAATFASGTIVSRDGLIVVADASISDVVAISVTLSDRRKAQAKVVVTDERSGLLLLKLDVSDLTPVELANTPAELGEEVVSLMCSDVNDRRVSRGIVSALNQTSSGRAMDLFETDIYPTAMSAGSPLSNLQGQLLGIIVAKTMSEASPPLDANLYSKVTASRSAHGRSLAVPVQYVREMLASYRPDQHVVLGRGWLGVAVGSVTGNPGARILKIVDGSPASETDVREGDIVLEVDGLSISNAGGLIREFGKLQPGQQVRLMVLRDGDRREIVVTVRSRPAPKPSPSEQTIRVWQPPVAVPTLTFAAPPAVGQPTPPLILTSPSQQTTAPTDIRTTQTAPAKPDPNAANPITVYTLPPSTPTVVRVERTDLEQKLDALTRTVKSLHDDVSKLREELRSSTTPSKNK